MIAARSGADPGQQTEGYRKTKAAAHILLAEE